MSSNLLSGFINEHQRILIKTVLSYIDFLTDQIDMLDQEVSNRLNIYHDDIDRLDSIPGNARRMAAQMLRLNTSSILKVSLTPPLHEKQARHVHKFGIQLKCSQLIIVHPKVSL